MKNLAQDFGTEEDTQELRDRMQEGRSKTSALCKDTTNLLKTPNSDKVRQDKLKRELQQKLAEYEKMAQEHRRQGGAEIPIFSSLFHFFFCFSFERTRDFGSDGRAVHQHVQSRASVWRLRRRRGSACNRRRKEREKIFSNLFIKNESRGRARTKLALELGDGMEDADVKIINERNREVQKLDEVFFFFCWFCFLFC
jgi:hypothetical protein